MDTKLKSGHVVVPLEGEELAEQERNFKFYSDGVVRLHPGGWLFPEPFLRQADSIYEHKFRPRDIIIVTYPKAGTTWVQEIVWTMKNNPDLDHPDANELLLLRSPFIEGDFLIGSQPLGDDHPLKCALKKTSPGQDCSKGIFFSLTEAAPDPRIIKTHLPLSLLPQDLLETSKVVYVARNPLDVCVSFYHHSRLFLCQEYVGTFDQFVDLFVRDSLMWSPHLLHLKEAWAKREHKNLHFMYFEDLKEDPYTELKKLDAFLETGLSEEKIKKIVDYTSFSAMRARLQGGVFPVKEEVAKEPGTGFFRKGEAGDWKVSMTPEQEGKILAWMDSGLKGEDLKFKHMERN